MILSVAMLLEWLGEHHRRAAYRDAGVAVHRAVDTVLADPQTRTADIGGQVGTRAFGAAVGAAVLR